jgi:chromosome segregation ATPase
MTDLPPDVRDRAAQAARLLPWPTVSGLTADEYWPAVVDAVAEVLAADQPKSTWPGDDFDGVRDALALEVRAHARTADELEVLRAWVEQLEGEVARRKRDGEALNTECEQIGEKADEAWRALNPYMARVEQLTTALTEIVAANDASTDQLPRSMWSAITRARAALSAGEEKS